MTESGSAAAVCAFDAKELARRVSEALQVRVRLALCDADEHLLDHPFADASPPAVSTRSSRHREWIAARVALQSILPRDRSAIAEHFPSADASLSHSRGRSVALFVADGAGCGVDIEYPRAMKLETVRHFLTATEREMLPPESDLLLLWTIKEAVFKADLDNAGRVMCSYQLDTFDTCGNARRVDHETPRFRYAASVFDDGWRIAVAVAIDASKALD